MTTIEQIRMARHQLIEFISAMSTDQVLPDLEMEHFTQTFDRFCYLQTEALKQATEVADENFERAQKLADQVQDNVKHIERLADDNQALTWMLEQKGYKPQKNAFGKIDSFVSGTHVVVAP